VLSDRWGGVLFFDREGTWKMRLRLLDMREKKAREANGKTWIAEDVYRLAWNVQGGEQPLSRNKTRAGFRNALENY
jgi:hypothetical protein